MQQQGFIINSHQLNMLRAIIAPILRNTRLCLQLVVQCGAKRTHVFEIIVTLFIFNIKKLR
jgi:hypothetical protein